jgi:hypothetical protein
VSIAITAKQRRRERRAQEHQVACCCAVCVPRGRRWPANYVGNGLGAQYADGDSGPLVVGISYDDYLARKPLYTEGHVYQGRPYSDDCGTTSSPSAAAMAALELADAKLEPQKIKRNLDDERETRAAYLAAFRDGWRYLADERRWIQVDEQPPARTATAA